MNGLILLADYFEEVEAFTPCDILSRAGDNITYVSCMKTLDVKTKDNFIVKCDILLDNVIYSNYDYLIIPGGKAAYTILNNDKRIELLIENFYNSKKLICSICAAPFLLGRKGYFKNMEYTVFPSFEKYFTAGIYNKNKGVIINENLITAKSMYYSRDFGLAIVKYLHGEIKSLEIEKQIKGE